jgi:hypothetical protein
MMPMVGLSSGWRSCHPRPIDRNSFARELGLEVLNLQFDHHKAAQAQVIEKQVEEVVLTANLKVILAADEGEPFPSS